MSIQNGNRLKYFFTKRFLKIKWCKNNRYGQNIKIKFHNKMIT